MGPNDGFAAAYNHRHGRSGHRAHPVFALPPLSRRKAHAKIHPIPGNGPSLCCVRPAGGLLPQGRKPVFGKPRHPGTALDRRRGRPASLEAADAAFHRRGDPLLYAAGAACVLRRYGIQQVCALIAQRLCRDYSTAKMLCLFKGPSRGG